MTWIPEEESGELSPGQLEFWLEEARMLEETAALSWRTDMRVIEQTKLMYTPQHDHVLRHATEELGVELNLLYRYLISLAIQYLAIGILIDRDPTYFLHKQPGHRIIKLVEACDVALSKQQRRLLKEVENAYDWAERYPVGQVAGRSDELLDMTHKFSQMERLTEEEKVVLDKLYANLQAVAEKRLK